MLDLGTVRPGSTIRIPFSTFDKDDGSSITMTNFAVGDILIYKDGSTTERASTNGFTATTDFDSKTGKQLAIIDLADNTTAGFYSAGSEYLVAIDAVTVDTVTAGGWIARFAIGYNDAILNTTIASLSSQTSFTLTDGPAEDDALNNCQIVIHDVASKVQVGRAVILDYTGSTKTVTLVAGTTFTAAATDNVAVLGLAPLIPTVAGRTLDVSTGGEAGIDWANVGTPGSTVSLSATTIATATTLTNAPSDSSGVTTLLSRIGGSITITSGRVNADVTHIATAAVNTSSAQLGVNVVNWGGTATGSALVRGNLIQVGGSATPVTNFATVFDTDFANNYNTTLDAWNVNTTTLSGENVATSIPVDFDLLANLDAAVSTRMATYTQPTGFLAATFPTTVASTTNITAGTITTATNVTTVNGLAANVITAASIAADAIGASELAADAVAEIQSGLSTLTAAGVRTAVGLASANLDTQLSAIDDYIDTEVAAIKTVTDRLDTAMELDGSVYRFTTNALEQAPSGSGASAADIADAVWDEVLSGHLTAGSTGNALNAAGSAGDPWTTTLPGSYTGSQAGFIIGTIRAAQLNILSPHVAEDSSTEIVIGDDYYAADNRNLSFLFGASPSLSGATVTLEIQIDTTAEDSDDNYTSTTGTASGTTSQTVTFDLPGTTTSDLSEGWHAYRVKAVLSNSHTVTLLRGRMNLLQRGDDAP